jgi:hypothetical protein
MIYLATPYSHPDPEVREKRFKAAAYIAGVLMTRGNIVFSPISHTHPIAMECNLPTDFAFWDKFDREFIAYSEKVLVVKLDGWDESKGIAGEIAIATSLGIPVEYVESYEF